MKRLDSIMNGDAGDPDDRRVAPASADEAPLTRRVRLVAIAVLAGIIVFAFARRYVDVSVPRPIGFRLLIASIALSNVIWWCWADAAIARIVRRLLWRRVLRASLCALMLLLLVPIVQAVGAGRLSGIASLPVWFVGGFQLWHMLIVLLVLALLASGAVVWILWRIARWLRAPQARASGDAPDPPADGPSRRQLLVAAGLYAPLVLVGGLAATHGRQTGRFLVRRFNHPAPWLPDRLRGLTLTHISDLHLGRLYRPEMLPRLIDEANRLDGDLVFVTGDVVDLSNQMLPPAIDALRQLRSRYGLYLCVGNHDLIDDGEEYVRTLRAAGFDLLTDERRLLTIGGERLTLAGLDWSRSDRAASSGRPGHIERTRATLNGYDPGQHGPCIAMAHHPHAFDALTDAGVPLTLSGHTHGGQLMLRPARADGRGDPHRDVGAGGIFRYVRGFYERDGRWLYVNSGVGNWFPVRVNAPAEIVQIRLT